MALETVPVTVCRHRFLRSSRSVAEERLMAPETVFLYNTPARLPDVNRLGFVAQCKDCGMPQPVVGLEIILPDEAVMRNMACIAVSNSFV